MCLFVRFFFVVIDVLSRAHCSDKFMKEDEEKKRKWHAEHPVIV